MNFGSLLLFLILHIASSSAGWAAEPSAAGRALVPVPLPPGVSAGGGCFDAAGDLHLVLSRNGQCSYAVRRAGHTALEPALAIPSPNRLTFGGERMPRILVDPAGTLFVLWQVKNGMELRVSRDRGKSWTQSPTGPLAGRAGIDVPNAAMGPDGTLYLMWVDERDPQLPDDDIAKHLYLATSTDGGRSFSTPRPITTDLARACPCCVPAITCGRAGEVHVAYRSSVANIKETHLLTSVDSGRTFAVRKLSDHRWFRQGCPMAGPSIAVAGPRIVVSWTSDGNMFTARSADGGKSFTSPERLGRGRFNQVAATAGGPLLLAWDEGHQTGLWWSDDPGPSPRIDVEPAGVLVAGPAGRFELLRPDAARPRHGH